MNRFTFPVAAFVASSLLGCTSEGLEGLGIEQDGIVNGKLSAAADDAVVSVQASGSSCTGTLIAPTVVLTALHCVTGFDSRFSFTCQSDGTLAPGSPNGQLGATLEPKSVTVIAGVTLDGERIHAKAIYSTESTDVCHDDLAVVVLESAPNIGDAPLVSLRFTRPTRKGELTRIAGYGDVEGTDTARGRQVRSDLGVRGVGGPDASTAGDKGTFPRMVQVGEGPCHGDSGGPLFAQETGAQIGVFSLIQNSTCTGPAVRNSYTQISYWESLIRMALESEGAEPILEPDEPSGSGGEAGASAAHEAGGTDGVGGSASGGSGGTGPTSEPVGEGAAPGDQDPDTGPEGNGRGSLQDSSCSCRTAGGDERAPWVSVFSTLALAAWSVSRRLTRREAAGSRRA